jgi:drug/metabolite transporter (DMT)-like permease
MRRKNKQILPIIALGMAFALWGLNTPLIKTSLESIPLFSLLFVKFTIGGTVFAFLAHKRWRPLPKKLRYRIIIATISGYVFTTALLYQGIKLTGGLNASLIYLLAPLGLYILSIKILKDRYDSSLLIGVIAGLLGALLIIGAPLLNSDSPSNSNLLGNILILAAISTDIIGTILIKPALGKIPVVQMTAVRFIIAAVVLLPFTFHEFSRLADVSISLATYLALTYNFIFATLVAFYLYHWGLRRISAEQASPLHYLDPMVGAVASIIILGERLTTTMIAGIILVVCGLYFGEVRKRKPVRHISHHR